MTGRTMVELRRKQERPTPLGGDPIRHSLREVLSVLFRHKRKMAIFFVSVVAAVAAYTFLASETYRSEAKLLIRLGRENLSVDPTVTGPTLGALSNRDAEGKAELAILTSRHLAERVVEARGDALVPGNSKAASDQSAREAAIRQILASLRARADLAPNIIDLTYTAPSAEAARDVLTAVIDQYLQRHIEVHSTQASPGFFERQTDRAATELAQAQQALDEFRKEHSITSFERQREVLLGQVSDLETHLYEAASEVESGRMRVTLLSDALRDEADPLELIWTPGENDEAVASLRQRLVDLRIEETAHSARFRADHPSLVEVRTQILQVEGLLSRAFQLALEKEQAQLATHEARQRFIARELEARRARLAELAGSEESLESLELRKRLADAEYRQYRENLQRARISTAMDLDKVSNVSVIQPATFPTEPVSPDKALNLVLAITLGALGAVLLAFLMDYMSDTLKTKNDVERLLGLPMLASISERDFQAFVAGAAPGSRSHVSD